VGYAQLSPMLVVDGGGAWGLHMGAPVRLRPWGGEEGAGRVRKEDLGFYYLAVGTGHGVYTLTQGQYEQATRELAPAALMVGLYAGGKGVRYLSETKGAAGIGEGGVRLQVPEPRLQVLKGVVERLRERLGEDGLGQLGRLIQGRREIAVMVAAGGEPVAMAIYEARGDLARAQATV